MFWPPVDGIILDRLNSDQAFSAVSLKDLNQPNRTAAERGNLAGERIAVRVVLHQRGEPFKAFSNFRVTSGHPHARARGDGDHRSSSAAKRSVRRTSASVAIGAGPALASS